MLARTLLSITRTEAGSLALRRDPEEMMIDERELTSEIDSELINIPEQSRHPRLNPRAVAEKNSETEVAESSLSSSRTKAPCALSVKDGDIKVENAKKVNAAKSCRSDGPGTVNLLWNVLHGHIGNNKCKVEICTETFDPSMRILSQTLT